LVTWSILGVIKWCCSIIPPIWVVTPLPGGVRLVTWTILPVINWTVFLTLQPATSNVSEKWYPTLTRS
jgi:hypothetical protein